MAYTKTNWQNDTAPSLSATNLNHIEQGIYDADELATSKYTKPSGGIPASDMTSEVQASLGLADTALQSVPSNYAQKLNVLTGTLTVAGWSSNTQTLTISGLATSGYGYIVMPAPASFVNYTDAQIYADDVTTANQITFHCTTTPTTAINIRILKGEVS